MIAAALHGELEVVGTDAAHPAYAVRRGSEQKLPLTSTLFNRAETYASSSRWRSPGG